MTNGLYQEKYKTDHRSLDRNWLTFLTYLTAYSLLKNFGYGQENASVLFNKLYSVTNLNSPFVVSTNVGNFKSLIFLNFTIYDFQKMVRIAIFTF